ncbi:MAG: hypothetical protein JWR21_3966 [Herminiimonas sp.]|nr:hypothetical protein [Herminiimonas sp.]MDB5853150.1 hypothetical protein [Herminiimonas sp.]
MMQPARFSVLSRSYCHLCDDMLVALKRELCARHPAEKHEIAVIDVDADPVLLAKYDELVPVLLGEAPDGRLIEICHYFLNPDRLAEFLRGPRLSSAA